MLGPYGLRKERRLQPNRVDVSPRKYFIVGLRYNSRMEFKAEEFQICFNIFLRALVIHTVAVLILKGVNAEFSSLGRERECKLRYERVRGGAFVIVAVI